MSYALDADTQPDKQSPSNNNFTESVLVDKTNKDPQKATLIIQISVPHNKNVVEACRIYPYPIAPPKKKGDPDGLPIKDKDLRALMLNLGYFNKTRQENHTL